MKQIIIDTLKRYKMQCAIQIVLLAINAYILTCVPEIIGNIVDMIYDMENNKQAILNCTYSILEISIFYIIIRISWKFNTRFFNRAFERDIRNKLFSIFLRIKIEKIQEIKNGELMSYFTKDINEIRNLLYKLISHTPRILFTFIIAIFQMASNVNISLTIVVVIPIIIAIFLVCYLRQRVEQSFKKAQEKYTKASEFIQESTDSIRTTKAYSCEQSQIDEFKQKNDEVLYYDNKVDWYSGLLSTCVNICFGICYAISLIYGSQLVLNSQITVGELVAFNGYISLFHAPITWIPGIVARMKRAKISYHRLDAICKLDKEKIEKYNSKTEKLNGEISVRNLSFHYPDYLENALSNISFELKKGKTLGIIGKVGSGKTTLMSLLNKLYQVPDGKIFIDGVDINKIPLETIRENICYITQDNFLFSTSIKENITLFKDEYEKNELQESIRDSMIYDEVEKMEDGLDTIIGERGIDLSGGQKQRVVVSRAFLKQSSIVIFDDTFSALDNKTEEKVLQNIRRKMKDKTCIIISNRISDVKQSDEILVLDRGEIIERGTHKELIKKQGEYYQFYMQQASKQYAILQ